MRFVYENGTIIINASFSGSKKTMENNTQLPLYSIFSLSSIIQNPIQALNNQELFLSLNQTTLTIYKFRIIHANPFLRRRNYQYSYNYILLHLYQIRQAMHKILLFLDHKIS